jgi:hypothetical protein
MLAYEVSPGVYAPWNGELLGGDDGVRHPLNVEELWSDADLLAAGLYRTRRDFAPPAGHVQVGAPRWEKQGDLVVEIFDVQPIAIEGLRAEKKAAIAAKRDATINAGFTFVGVRFQTRPDDRENIAGAAQLAAMAIAAGAPQGYLRWHGGESDFAWIAEDNSLVPMDAYMVIGFAKAIAAFKSACIFYARALKDAVDAADDVSAVDIGSGWPA